LKLNNNGVLLGGGFLPPLNLNRHRAISKTSIVLKRGFLNRRDFWLSETVPFVVSAKQEPGPRQTLTRGNNAIQSN
jgi:hypothetical protein